MYKDKVVGHYSPVSFDDLIKTDDLKKWISPIYCQNHSCKELKGVGVHAFRLMNVITSKLNLDVPESEIEDVYVNYLNMLKLHFHERFISSFPKLIKKRGGVVKKHKENFRKIRDLKYVKGLYFKFLIRELYFISQKKKEVGGKGDKNNYTSLKMMKIRKEQIDYNNEYLKNTLLSNGKTAYDYKKTDKNKLIELYLTVKGYQDIANEKGFKWLFITLTLPAEFHSNPSKGKNSWDGSTVRDGKNFLQDKLRLMRGKLKSDQKEFNLDNGFGIRVSEPQKDGTIHYHIVLFVNSKYKQYYCDTFRYYFERTEIINIGFRKENRNHGCLIIEEGIDKDGVDVKEKDLAKVSTYILKYCLKGYNINDVDNKDFVFSKLDAVNAWKAMNGIRAISDLGVKGFKSKYRDCRKIANYLNVITKGFGGKVEVNNAIMFMTEATKEVRDNYTSINQGIKFYDSSASKALRKARKDALVMFDMINTASVKTDKGINMASFIKNAAMLDYEKVSKNNRFGEVVKTNAILIHHSAKFELKKAQLVHVVE